MISAPGCLKNTSVDIAALGPAEFLMLATLQTSSRVGLVSSQRRIFGPLIKARISKTPYYARSLKRIA